MQEIWHFTALKFLALRRRDGDIIKNYNFLRARI